MDPRTMTLILNDRCPLRCAHCALGYSENNIGSGRVMDETTVEELICGLDPDVYTMVVLAGGEPALVPKLVSKAVNACRKTGIDSALTTAPFWARTTDLGRMFLDRISQPNFVILSFDKYHLDFITVSHYENAVAAAYERGIRVALNICYSTASEREASELAIRGLVTRLTGVTWSRVMPQGNASDAAEFVQEGVTINSLEDLDKVPRSCKAGNALVNLKNELHACCWSGDVSGSPLIFSDNASFSGAVRSMDDNGLFQRIHTRGVLGNIPDKHRTELLSVLRGRSFVNECHLCVTLMREKQKSFAALLGEPSSMGSQCSGSTVNSTDYVSCSESA